MKQDLDSLYYDRERLIEENEILAEQIQNFKPKPAEESKQSSLNSQQQDSSQSWQVLSDQQTKQFEEPPNLEQSYFPRLPPRQMAYDFTLDEINKTVVPDEKIVPKDLVKQSVENAYDFMVDDDDLQQVVPNQIADVIPTSMFD